MRFLPTGIIAVLLVAGPAQAAPVTASLGVVKAAMADAGFTVTEDTTPDGYHELQSVMGNDKFWVSLQACSDNGTGCDAVEFEAAFKGDNAITAARINQWNAENRYGTAYIDEDGDAHIKMETDLAPAGMPADLFRHQLRIWGTLILSFENFLNRR